MSRGVSATEPKPKAQNQRTNAKTLEATAKECNWKTPRPSDSDSTHTGDLSTAEESTTSGGSGGLRANQSSEPRMHKRPAGPRRQNRPNHSNSPPSVSCPRPPIVQRDFPRVEKPPLNGRRPNLTKPRRRPKAPNPIKNPTKSGPGSFNLEKDQIKRLMAVLTSMVIVNSSQPPLLSHRSAAPPTFALRPIDFLEVLIRNLEEAGIYPGGVRLYGGAASYVISDSAATYNDIDLMIHVNFDVESLHFFLDTIKDVVLKSLREIVGEIILKFPSCASLDDATLTSSYIAKMYKHAGDPRDSENIWSLFSFNNFQGRNIEVKFVHTLERQYKFSIDSFQIDLSKEFLLIGQHYTNEFQLNKSNWPATTCYCLYPDVKLAINDVSLRRIRVINPGAVRGGCFLRYAGLLDKKFVPTESTPEVKMISRFLSDFTGANDQAKAIESYIHNHMGGCGSWYKRQYLSKLEETVDRLFATLPGEALANTADTLQHVIRTKLITYRRAGDIWPPFQHRNSPYPY